VHRERPLDADAERLLADGKGLTDPCALALDHDALEDLDAAPLALDHLEVDTNRVPRLELRNTAAQLSAFEFLDDLAHKKAPVAAAEHGSNPARSAPFRRKCFAFPTAKPDGRAVRARPMAAFAGVAAPAVR
jgi:hypothetical protein